MRKEESSDERLFMQEISQKLYPEGRCPVKEKLIFEVCYAPENMGYDPENIGLSTEELAEYLNNRYLDNGQRQITAARVSQLRTVVAKRLLEEFQDEMIADQVEAEKITDGGRGGNKPHEKPYRIAGDWLWRCKFSRWRVDLALKPLITDADQCSDWIDFHSVDVNLNHNRALKVNLPPQPPKPKIPVDVPFLISVNLPNPRGYFLLINRGLVTRLCICPSLYLAPDNQVFERNMLMPQDNAMSEDIVFNEVGKEEFIGIKIDRRLILDWLQPNEEEGLPILNPERSKQLLSELEGIQYQVFYRSFDVVKTS